MVKNGLVRLVRVKRKLSDIKTKINKLKCKKIFCDIFSKMNRPDLFKNIYKDKVFTATSSSVILLSLFVGIYIR